MTTHRSLNKLEFKAHMSIHNFVEVTDLESMDLCFTRDRFGKKHSLAETDGSLRIQAFKRQVGAVLVFAGFLGFSGRALADVPTGSVDRRKTNVQVSSSDLEPLSVDDRLKVKRERAVFYEDGTKSLNINEDGDPNLSMRF